MAVLCGCEIKVLAAEPGSKKRKWSLGVLGSVESCNATLLRDTCRECLAKSKTGNVYFHLYIIGKIGQENVLRNILQRKKAFPHYKNNKLKKSKIWDFSKGVSPCYWSKIRNFSIFLT